MKSLFKRIINLFSKSSKQLTEYEAGCKHIQRLLLDKIKDPFFIKFANEFFASKWHFCRPIAIDEMVISFLEHKGEQVTSITVKKFRDEVMGKMDLYCQSLHYSMNPQIVYRGDSSSKYPRRKAWVTSFMNDKPISGPRTQANTRCCYFYKMGDEPRSTDEILQCPERDEERLEEMEREERE